MRRWFIIPSVFVLKVMRIPYREIVVDNPYDMESVFDGLPDGSLLTVRHETASVDQWNFADWARHFVTAMRPKTMNGCKVLLTYDVYRCHITLRALDILSKGVIIAYCLLAHTSGKTQPLDVGVYGPFRSRLHDEVHTAEQCGYGSEFDQFDLLHMITRAYAASFTKTNILSSFRKSGLWPFDGSALLGVPHPATASEPDAMITVDQLSAMLYAKRAQAREGNCLQPIEIRRGFLNTTQGLVVSQEEAMRSIAEKESPERGKNAQKASKEAEE